METIQLNLSSVLTEESVCVQIGAFDGISNDEFFLNSIDSNTKFNKIILIEPISEFFRLLSINYSHRKNFFIENIGISDKNDFETFYINGQDTSIVRKHEGVEERLVKCYKFDYIIQKYELSNIDVLILDVEGYEFILLKSILEYKIPIKYIRFEFWHLSDEDKINLDNLLQYNGYDVYFDSSSYADKIAIKK